MRADFALDYDVLMVSQPQKIYLLAKLESGKSELKKRRPLNLSLVIDRSGSMAGSKIEYTVQASQFLVQHLSAQDLFSVVLYNDRVETLFGPDHVKNKDTINQLLHQIVVRGTTNLSGGWLAGCSHVKEQFDDKSLNRVILMSDGLANRGVTDPKKIIDMAQKKYGENISTTTMGLGNDFNEDLMMSMSKAGGGAFYFIESPEVAPAIFKEELEGLLNIVGQNLSITIQPTKHVRFVQQLNAYPVDLNGDDISFRLGDIFAEELKTLVLEISIPAMQDLGKTQIATLRFEYDEVVGENTIHHVDEMPVFINVSNDITSKTQVDKDVIQSVLLLRAANARQKAVERADVGDFNTASQILREVADAIANAPLDDEQLKEEESALLDQANQIEKGYDQYSRKTMSTQAFYTMTNRHDETVVLRFREVQREIDEAIQNSEPIVVPDDVRATMQDAIPAINVENVLDSGSSNDDETQASNAIPITNEVPTHMTWNSKTFALTGDMIRLGRSRHNEIMINEKGVSRFHAQIRRKDGQLILEDLNSTNGTLFGEKPLTKPHTLTVGDEVYLCDEKLLFHVDPDRTMPANNETLLDGDDDANTLSPDGD